MRLIDADELVEEIKSMKIWLRGKDIFPPEAKESIVQLIEDEPTAYDIDKVVEELEEATFYDESGVHTVIGSGRAIEIVKEGGKEC